MKKNFFISTGYFSTLTSSLVIDFKKSQSQRNKKNYLLIIISKEFSKNEDFKIEADNQMFFAKNVSNWYKIDVISEKDFPLSVYNTKNSSETLNSLFQNKMKELSFLDLYISSLNLLDKLSTYINFKRVNIIDEGIGTHLQIENTKDLSDFYCFYKLIPLDCKKINNIKLPKNLLYKKLNKLNRIYKTPKIIDKTNIFAISSFYFIQQKKEILLNSYRNNIFNLLNSKERVKIKLHPRNNKDDFLDLQNHLLDLSIPLLDMYLIKNKKYVKNLYSMNSSILFLSKYIYKIPVKFINNEVKDEYTKKLNEVYIKYLS